MKRVVATMVLVGVIVAAAIFGYEAWLGEPADQPVASAPQPSFPLLPVAAAVDAALPAPLPAFVLLEVRGHAAIRSGGTWRPAVKGDRLFPTDAIRTEPGAAAVLGTDTGDELALRERVELELDELADTVTRLSVARGKVGAAAGASSRPMEISAGETETVGRPGSKFTVYVDPRGSVAVAAAEGEVAVSAKGERVEVPPARVTYVAPGAAPTAPVPIPEVVFLAIKWPGPVSEDPAVDVAGKAAPGSIVQVNGAEAQVAADGRFKARVDLREGANRIEVSAEGIDGRTEKRTRDVERRIPHGPPLEADPSRLYDPPPRKPR